jgi:16S rRNA (guanine1207-N2)-methyltransferase
MPSRRREVPLSQRQVPDAVRTRAKHPLLIILGSPAEVINLLAGLEPTEEVVCFQFDLHQADKLRFALIESGLRARVEVAADLWDLPADFQTAIYLPARRGERELKIDMVDQAFHVLRSKGQLIVWSPYEVDPFFPNLLKKIFGKSHTSAEGGESVFWAVRDGDRPRRRHEVTFQAKVNDGASCRFVSRPGTFSYGRFDNGARALAEVMEIQPGAKVVDIGCGCGTNGIFAAQLAGPEGFITFVDSNSRALALAELNAAANGLTAFRTIASHTVEGPGLEQGRFDVALANPPYFAAGAITQLFAERAHFLLRPGGQLFLVTKHPDEVGEMLAHLFGGAEGAHLRGYTVLIAVKNG